MSVCERCTENHNCAWQNHEETICHERPAFPLTNADRIRAMTDEELADLFISIGDGNTPEKMVFSARDMRYERKMWLDWLKQSAEKGKT